jgi:hypothetical protein
MSLARKKAAQAKRDAGEADGSPHDALVLLTADHNEIDKLVREFDRRRRPASTREKGKLALRICTALTVHGRIKKEVFYPAAETALEGEDKELLAKVHVEQDELQHLIGKIETMPADGAGFDSAVLLLTERAARQMKQEEDELFPRLRHSGLDLLGTASAWRRAKLSWRQRRSAGD